MNTTTNVWPLISIAASVITMIIAGLLARWTAGVVQNLKADIRIAILEKDSRDVERFATKGYVDQQVDLAGRIESVPTKVVSMLRGNRDHGAMVR